MKATFVKNLMLADHIRADAGIAEAVGERRLSAVYTAAYHVHKSGNKTQWNIVTAAVAQYADIKNVKAALDASRITPAVRRMHDVYAAYGAAIAHCGAPSLMKDATPEAIDEAAQLYATEFVAIVSGALEPVAPVVKSEAEKAAAKAEKEAKAKAAEKAQADTIKAKAQELAQANVPTLADMVRTVANAIKQGMLDADALAMLDGALDTVATSIKLDVVEVEPEQVAA